MEHLNYEPVSNARSTISHGNRNLEVSIPAKRNYFVIAFLSFWLTGWTIGGFIAIGVVLFSSTPISAQLFLLFWLCGWFFGEVAAGSTLLWQLTGKEIISINNKGISLTSKIVSFSKSKHYHINNIRNLGIASTNSSTPFNTNNSVANPMLSKFLSFVPTTGQLSFSNGMKTIRFAAEVDEAEAQQILAAIIKSRILTEDHFKRPE